MRRRCSEKEMALKEGKQKRFVRIRKRKGEGGVKNVPPLLQVLHNNVSSSSSMSRFYIYIIFFSMIILILDYACIILAEHGSACVNVNINLNDDGEESAWFLTFDEDDRHHVRYYIQEHAYQSSFLPVMISEPLKSTNICTIPGPSKLLAIQSTFVFPQLGSQI